jgi:peptidoglycan hydrolase-like protein with peptidoglycan-binding domain
MAALLTQGSTGPAVRQVQEALNKTGPSALPKLKEDGIFGPKTRARVVEFQKSRGLVPDGIVGPKTRAALGTPGGQPGTPTPGGGGGGPSKPIGDPAPVVNAVVAATQVAHTGGWRPQARFQGLKIMAVTAIGGPGCLTGPDLGGLVMSQPQITTLQGDDRLVAQAAATGIGQRFAAWQNGVTVPGLPWYPTFAAVPAPMAPPTPNVPMPLTACPSSGLGGLTSASSLSSAMAGALDPAVKARDPGGKAGQIFGAAADQVAVFFLVWITSQMVHNVLGQGPVPSFAPPFVPVGPVVGGFVISTPGHLA